MGKTKKISVNAFETAVKNTYNPIDKFEWNGIEVIVRKTLPISDMITFVKTVVHSCFTSETNEYMPEAKEFAIKSCVLEQYANFTMPRNGAIQYELVYCSDVVSEVLKRINTSQYCDIIQAIDKKIDYICNSNIEAINKQMNEVFNTLNNLQEQMESIFSGVTPDSVDAIANALKAGALDEEKMVKSYLEQIKVVE